jgi:ATP-dependent Clp protease ATP-binding subunit ClpC
MKAPAAWGPGCWSRWGSAWRPCGSGWRRSPAGASRHRPDVLELALQESRALGHNYIGTEHILLGVIHEGDGVAAHVLSELGADLDGAREQVIRLLAEHRRQTG